MTDPVDGTPVIAAIDPTTGAPMTDATGAPIDATTGLPVTDASGVPLAADTMMTGEVEEGAAAVDPLTGSPIDVAPVIDPTTNLPMVDPLTGEEITAAIDPATGGALTDPETGAAIDAATGEPVIDPATGAAVDAASMLTGETIDGEEPPAEEEPPAVDAEIETNLGDADLTAGLEDVPGVEDLQEMIEEPFQEAIEEEAV